MFRFNTSQLKIDVDALHRAKCNIQADIPLTRACRKALVQLIEAEKHHFCQPDLRIRLKGGLERFSKVDRRLLLDMIQVSEGDLYPSQMAINRHEYHISQLEKLSPRKDCNQYEMISNMILEFRTKYCRR